MGNPYAQMIAQAAAAYGADAPTLMGIAKLESGFNPGSVNNWDSNAKRGTPSQGMFQFIRPTFDAFSRQARAADPAAWAGVGGNWLDPKAQALTTAWAITHGHSGDWTTFGRASQGRVGLTSQPQDQVQSLAPPDPHIAAREGLIGDLFQNDPWFVKAITSKMDNASAAATPAAAQSAPLGAPTAGGAPGSIAGIASSQIGSLAAQAARWVRASGQPFDSAWCGDFVQSVFARAGLPVPPARSVPKLLAWAQGNNTFSHNAIAGEPVMFDWNGDGVPDHVGIVTGVHNGMLTEVGGNQRAHGGHGVTQDTFRLNSPNILGYVGGRQ